MSLIKINGEIRTETRKGSPIPNAYNRRSADDGDRLKCEQLKREFPNAKHRSTNFSAIYNCHGHTFASRRTNIWKANAIRQILVEDEYRRVNLRDVLPGDVIIYVASDGDIDHSGIVVSADTNLLSPKIVVLSKWGMSQEVLHDYLEGPYSKNVEFYRIDR